MKDRDEKFMKMALSLARRYEGLTSPNPSVGAVLVKNGKVIARGVHRGPGTSHAEAEAIFRAGKKAKGAVLYVTLEPCNHYGRTPPCTLAVIKAGIKRVVYGVKDENPEVKGGGADFLKESGVIVERFDPGGEVAKFYAPYLTFVREKRPFVILKLALTLNARIAFRKNSRDVISSPEALKYAHILRKRADAVLVGADTVITDDPLLTVRLVKVPSRKKLWRVILDSHLRVPLKSRVFEVKKNYPTLVVTSREADRAKQEKLRQKGVEVVEVRRGDGGVNVRDTVRALAERGIMSILVEGGARVAESFLKEGLVDRMIFIFSPVVAPGFAPGIFEKWRGSPVRWKIVKVEKLGQSVALIMER